MDCLLCIVQKNENVEQWVMNKKTLFVYPLIIGSINLEISHWGGNEHLLQVVYRARSLR